MEWFNGSAPLLAAPLHRSIMLIKLIMLIGRLLVAFVVNDTLHFLDWSIGIVTGVLFADLWLNFLVDHPKARRFWCDGSANPPLWLQRLVVEKIRQYAALLPPKD